MGKVSRSTLLSGAFHVRWPTIYNARYLSSFAYRLSGEHLSIIKRRYLSRHMRFNGRSFIDATFLGLLRGDVYFRGKKSVTRILHELPTRYRSRHSRRGTRQVLSSSVFDVDRSVHRSVVVLGGPRWLSEEFAVVEDRSVWSLKKLYGVTEQSGAEEKEHRARSRHEEVKKSEKERKRKMDRNKRRLWRDPWGEGFSLVPSRDS